VKDAARVVVFLFADFHHFLPLCEALREAGGLTAYGANGGEERDAVCDGEERGAWAGERIAGERLVQDDDDHAAASEAKPLHEGDELVVEELTFIDANDLDVVGDDLSHLCHGVNRCGHEPSAAVACELNRVIASAVVGVLEYDELLFGEDHSAQQPNELFRLSSEHATGDDFNSASAVVCDLVCIHERLLGDVCILDDKKYSVVHTCGCTGEGTMLCTAL